MSEKRYKLKLPRGITCSECRTGLDITKEHVPFLREQLDAIEAQPEEPAVRIGDIWVGVWPDLWRVNFTGTNQRGDKKNWVTSDGTILDYLNPEPHHFVGNLRDLLAQGDVLIALTEGELQQTANWIYGDQLVAKLSSYLADYRQRRREHEK